ncbi:MAG TPA: PAS domain S-box protein [Acidimicrobiia bacterium]
MVPQSDPEQLDAFLRNAFVHVPAAIAAIGLDGRLIACNPAFEAIVGAGAEDLTGVDAMEFVHPDDIDQAVAASIERIEGRQARTDRPQPIRVVRRDGGTAWVQFDSTLIDGGPGDPYVLATMTDVSIQIAADDARARDEAWFRALIQHQSDIITVVGFDGMVRYISPNCQRLLGFDAESLIGTSGIDNIHPDDIGSLIDGLGAQLTDGLAARPFEYRQRRSDGSWLWLEATGKALPAEFGVDAVIVNARDITERRRAHEAARDAEARFRVAFSTSPLGIGFANLNGRFTWVNDALVRLVGVPELRLLEMSFQDLSDDAELAHEIAQARRLLRGEIDSFCTEKRYQHPDSRVIWARLHVSLVRDAGGDPSQFLGQLEDITEQKDRELSLSHDAMHDPLTGLFNRSGLRERVDAAWAARRPATPMAIIFGDLDGFKHVNDSLGHDAGDEVLVHVARRLTAAVRPDDVVARWGGDEFVIVCPRVSGAEEARRIADRVRVTIEAPFRLGPGQAEIGISFGVAVDTGQPLPDLLLKDADEAAYRAKLDGRNRVVVHSPAS